MLLDRSYDDIEHCVAEDLHDYVILDKLSHQP